MLDLRCLDLGTSSAKAVLIDLNGRTIAFASAEYPTRQTPDGGAQQIPADWVRAARAAIARALPPRVEVAALCLTGQMQDLVLEGEYGAVHPAVLYTDLRAGADALELDHGIVPLLEQGGDVTEPDPSSAAAYAELRSAHRRLYRAVADIGQ